MRPMSPVPKRNMVVGSGTGAGDSLVSINISKVIFELAKISI